MTGLTQADRVEVQYYSSLRLRLEPRTLYIIIVAPSASERRVYKIEYGAPGHGIDIMQMPTSQYPVPKHPNTDRTPQPPQRSSYLVYLQA